MGSFQESNSTMIICIAISATTKTNTISHEKNRLILYGFIQQYRKHKPNAITVRNIVFLSCFLSKNFISQELFCIELESYSPNSFETECTKCIHVVVVIIRVGIFQTIISSPFEEITCKL